VGNTWFADSGSVSLVDGIRLIATHSSAVTTLLQGNVISGRYGIRSETSTWTLQTSRIHGANVGVVLSNADTATLVSDTLTAALNDCVAATGSMVRLGVAGGLFTQCGPGGAPAINVNAPGAVVDVSGGATFIGAAWPAVVVAGAHHASVLGNTMMGNAAGGAVTTPALNGVIDLQADSVIVVGNAVTGYPSYAALSMDGTAVRADSNFISRNRVGIQAGTVSLFEANSNDIFDNDTAGVVNEQAAGVSIPSNWWGDSLGPRGVGVQAAVGDSVVGNVSFQPTGFIPLHAGFRASPPLRVVRGNGQSAPQGTALPLPLAVRVVDGTGRPVAGVAVTFTASAGGVSLNGGGATMMQTTNSSGLAEAMVVLGSPGNYTITASNAAVGGVTFAATATP
jgi:hypothetical protein